MKLKIFLLVAVLAISAFGTAAQNAKSKTEPIASGAIAPNFTLNDQNGKSVTLFKAENNDDPDLFSRLLVSVLRPTISRITQFAAAERKSRAICREH